MDEAPSLDLQKLNEEIKIDLIQYTNMTYTFMQNHKRKNSTKALN